MKPSTHHVDGWSVVFTDRAVGDFSPDSPGIAGRRAGVVGTQPVLWLRQTHGNDVVRISDAADVERLAGSHADAAVTTAAGIALSVVTADCAPIAIVAGSVGAVVHAGWHGLLRGVIEATIDAVRELAGESASVTALLGPCIHPASYEFGPDDLERVAARYGDSVRSRTANGTPALDMPAAVQAAFAMRAVDVDVRCARDTAAVDWFSHLTRGDRERQSLFLWRNP